MKTRILYLTKDCNFNCSYCFEKNKHKKESISYEELDRSILNMVEEELTDVTTICFFGGEPLLEFDKMKYVFQKCKEIKNNLGKKFAFNTITNGSLIHKYTDDISKMINDDDFSFSLHVSFDGSFQDRRSSNKIVEKNLNLLKEKKIPFGVSYTILNENSDFKVVIKDLVTIIKKYFLDDFNKESIIRLNFDRTDLESGGKNYSEYINQLTLYLNYLYEKYKIPFCSMTCDICKRCDKGIFTGTIYTIPGEKTISMEKNGSLSGFTHF